MTRTFEEMIRDGRMSTADREELLRRWALAQETAELGDDDAARVIAVLDGDDSMAYRRSP